MEFIPPFSPKSNRIYERNNYSTDVAVKMMMEEDKRITFQEAGA